MDDGAERPVLKAILVVTLTMIGIWFAFVAAEYAFDFEPPSSAGTLNTILSTVVGVSWFGRKMNRRMEKAERVWFATGVLMVNALLPLSYIVGSLLYLGMPVSLTSFDLVFGDGSGFLMEGGFAWIMTFMLAFSFVQAYVFAWLLLRKFGDGVAST